MGKISTPVGTSMTIIPGFTIGAVETICAVFSILPDASIFSIGAISAAFTFAA